MLVSMNEILRKARKEGYGVIASTIFDVHNFRAAIEAAEEMNSPIILNVNLTTSFLKNTVDAELYTQVARVRSMNSKVPVAINCDHGRSFEMCMNAIHWGFTSVMIDASTKPFEENVAITRKVCEAAHACGCSVEAELGCVGIANPTDSSLMKSFEGKAVENIYTDPQLVKEFVERTGVDCLAISIGNAHGPYAKGIVPHIEFELLDEIAHVTDIPLVLHGGSGTGDENLAKACSMGISKINVASDLMAAAITRFMDSESGFSRFRFEEALDAYKETIKHYMTVFGSVDKA